MGITLKEIGKLAGVHESTVSRALVDSPLVEKSTKDRIHAIALKYDYRPNRLARGLAGQKTNLIGVIVPDLMSSYYPEIIHGIEDFCGTKQYHILFSRSDFKPDEEKYCVDMLMERKVDGVIWCSPNLSNLHLLYTLKNENIPTVLVDVKQDNPYNCDFVTVDNVFGGYHATYHLLQMGHKFIAFIGDEVTTPDRYYGYEKALVESRIVVDSDLIIQTKIRHELGGYQATKELLKRKKPFTAIFAVNDNMAIGAIRMLEDAQLKVPSDVAVVGYDDIQVAAYLNVPLTTIRQPKYDVGVKASEILLEKLRLKNYEDCQRIVLKPELIIRQSSVAENCTVYR